MISPGLGIECMNGWMDGYPGDVVFDSNCLLTYAFNHWGMCILNVADVAISIQTCENYYMYVFPSNAINMQYPA